MAQSSIGFGGFAGEDGEHVDLGLDLVVEVRERLVGAVLGAHLLIEIEVEHLAELFAGHEGIGVEERIAADLSCEVFHLAHGVDGLERLALEDRQRDAVDAEVEEHAVVGAGDAVLVAGGAKLALEGAVVGRPRAS